MPEQTRFFEFPEKIFVEDLNEGDQVSTLFAVTHMSLKNYTGGKFLQMKLGDSSGRMGAVLWSDAESAYQNIHVGDLVHVEGTVDLYREKKQLTIKSIRKMDPCPAINLIDFIPTAEIDTENLLDELKSIARSVKDPNLLNLLAQFFNDKPIIEAFCRAPGGKQWHHGYLGGLLEHTLGVVKNCQVLASRYPFIKKDALLVGAIFHDLGKVFEFMYETVIEYSDSGRLIGHQIMGDQKLTEYAGRCENFPVDLLLEIRHLVLSHHGDSPDAVRKPATREALILSRADDLDAQMNAFTRELMKARESGRKWTDHVFLIDRYLYDSGDNNNGQIQDEHD